MVIKIIIQSRKNIFLRYSYKKLKTVIKYQLFLGCFFIIGSLGKSIIFDIS